MITEEALRHDSAELKSSLVRARERQRRALQIHAESEAALFAAGRDVGAIERALENNAILIAVVVGDKREAAE